MMVLWIEVGKMSRDLAIYPHVIETKALKYTHKMLILLSNFSKDKHGKTLLFLNVLQRL